MYPLNEHIVSCETDSLSILNKLSITAISNYLGIDTDIITNPDFSHLEEQLDVADGDVLNNFPELRMSRPDIKLIRAIAMCRNLKATTFINPIGGSKLYPKNEFAQNGIEILFLEIQGHSLPTTFICLSPKLVHYRRHDEFRQGGNL